MSGRVCVIVEYCNAINDEFESYNMNKAVAGNPTIAENLIETYKNDLIKRTYDEGGIATVTTTVGGNVTVIVELHDDCITYKYEYYWTIEQFDIEES